MMRGLVLLALMGPLALAACGPPSPEQIERDCRQRAWDAGGPRGEVRLGVASDGRQVVPTSGVSLSISSDALRGLDPALVYERCMIDRTGKAPRPYDGTRP